MKKFVSVVLALTMIISMCATVSAATVLELIDGYLSIDADNTILNFHEESALKINIEARKTGSATHVASPLNIVDSNLSNGVGVDFKATLDMKPLRDVFDGLFYTMAKDATDFTTGKVATEITVTIDYPGAVINDITVGSLTNNNGIFQPDGDRIPVDADTLKIKFNNNANGILTAGVLAANVATYLADLTFTLPDGAVIYNTEGSHTVTVTLEGKTTLTFDSTNASNKNPIIKYSGTADYIVNTDIPSSGGGGSSYNSIKFVANGGNELKNISVRRGGKVSELPVPVREGYVFTGWYTDSALKTPFDKDTVINKNYTLYAAWVEDSGTVEIVHETPEMLNGEDHFAYVLGYPDGTVRPNANITRAEVTSIFFRLLKDEVREENLTNDNSFNDVNGEDWYNTAVSTMAKLGIVNGRTADEFVPNANITRAEFAAICARFDESQYSIVDKFTDIISHWAEDEIHETAAYGWIKGYEDGTFKPDKAITRAEAMTMINRVLNRVPETADDLLSDMIVWPDNSENDWYYLPVQEATNGHNYEMKNNIYEKWTEITDVTDWTKYE